MKIVKSVATKRYEIALVEADSGLYYIRTEIKGADRKSEITDGMEDLRIAFHAYDVKLNELEGH